MNANELHWMRDMHKKDTLNSTEDVAGETVYTIYMADLLRMPDVNFSEVAIVDGYVRALLN